MLTGCKIPKMRTKAICISTFWRRVTSYIPKDVTFIHFQPTAGNLEIQKEFIRRNHRRDFTSNPVVTILCFYCSGAGSIPDWGTKSPHAVQCCQKIKNLKRKKEIREEDKVLISLQMGGQGTTKDEGCLPNLSAKLVCLADHRNF